MNAESSFKFPRCKDCKHWTPAPEKYPNSWRDKPEYRAGGFCGSSNFSEDYGYAPTSLVYSYMEGGEFWTGADFGCVNHEPCISSSA